MIKSWIDRQSEAMDNYLFTFKKGASPNEQKEKIIVQSETAKSVAYGSEKSKRLFSLKRIPFCRLVL